jgi:hypothetical protein
VTAAIPQPPGIQRLPLDRHGRRVPWFVAWIGGEPDFRVVGTGRLNEAMRTGACWICGGPPDVFGLRAYVVGPMCAVNRVSAEPPSHVECATYAARACPFLTRPDMRRRPNLPDGTVPPAGKAILRNPGVALVWVTRGGGPFVEGTGWLWDIGDAVRADWWREARPARRTEVVEALDRGMPVLEAEAAAGGPGALRQLAAARRQVEQLLPVA